MSWLEDKVSILETARTYDKSIKLYTKDNFFSKAIASILWFLSYVFTFGQGVFQRKDFLENYATSIGPYHFYPKEWTTFNVNSALPHEAQHTKQARALSLFTHPVLGILPSLLVYIFPIPIGFALGRLWMEIDADKAKWKVIASDQTKTKEAKVALITIRAYIFAGTISSQDYLWTTPLSLTKWYTNREVEKFLKKEGLA